MKKATLFSLFSQLCFYKFKKLETGFENSFLRQDPSRQSLRTFGSSESVGSQGSRRPYSRYGWILGFKVSLLRVQLDIRVQGVLTPSLVGYQDSRCPFSRYSWISGFKASLLQVQLDIRIQLYKPSSMFNCLPISTVSTFLSIYLSLDPPLQPRRALQCRAPRAC